MYRYCCSRRLGEDVEDGMQREAMLKKKVIYFFFHGQGGSQLNDELEQNEAEKERKREAVPDCFVGQELMDKKRKEEEERAQQRRLEMEQHLMEQEKQFEEKLRVIDVSRGCSLIDCY